MKNAGLDYNNVNSYHSNSGGREIQRGKKDIRGFNSIELMLRR